MAYNSKKCLTFGESGLVKIASGFTTNTDGTNITLRNSDSTSNYAYVIIPFYFEAYDSEYQNDYTFGSVFTCLATSYTSYGQYLKTPWESEIYYEITYYPNNTTVNISASATNADHVYIAGIWGITAS